MAQKSSTQLAKEARDLKDQLVSFRLELHALAKKDPRLNKAVDLDNSLNSNINNLGDLNKALLKYGDF